MLKLTYSLDKTSYSWQNALLWSSFVGHCKKANQGSWGNRIVHALIAAAEFLPIISQISSICEKLIIDNFSSSKPFSTGLTLTHKKMLIETTKEKHKDIPKPNLTENKFSIKEPLKEYRMDLLSELPKTIESQQKHKTYRRRRLTSLKKQDCNLPIKLTSLPKKVKYFSENATFYGYNAEGIRDYGWGCAWRAIQTCLSAYKIDTSFEELFHLFGPLKNLKIIYQNKYPAEELSNSKLFAPYDLFSGWAEPFIGHMVMHFYNIPSALETVNGIPCSCYAPQHVFHNKPLDFKIFRDRLESHFELQNSAPVMIDDGVYALNIIGIEKEELNTILWIADPHINEGVNYRLTEETSPAGLYKITLNDKGNQLSCTLANEDKHQVSTMFSAGSYKGLHFDNKNWMVLFPFK